MCGGSSIRSNRLRSAADDVHPEQRVAAQLEEVVGHAEPLQAQRLAPDLGDRLSSIVAGRLLVGGDQLGTRVPVPAPPSDSAGEVTASTVNFELYRTMVGKSWVDTTTRGSPAGQRPQQRCASPRRSRCRSGPGSRGRSSAARRRSRPGPPPRRSRSTRPSPPTAPGGRWPPAGRRRLSRKALRGAVVHLAGAAAGGRGDRGEQHQEVQLDLVRLADPQRLGDGQRAGRAWAPAPASSSSGCLNCISPIAGTPATCSTPCRAPNRSRATLTARRTSSGSLTSPTTISTSAPSVDAAPTPSPPGRRTCLVDAGAPASDRRPAVPAAGRCGRAAPVSRVQSRASCSAIARPMPPRPPVTRYTPPSRSGRRRHSGRCAAGCRSRAASAGRGAARPAGRPGRGAVRRRVPAGRPGRRCCRRPGRPAGC